VSRLNYAGSRYCAKNLTGEKLSPILEPKKAQFNKHSIEPLWVDACIVCGRLKIEQPPAMSGCLLNCSIVTAVSLITSGAVSIENPFRITGRATQKSLPQQLNPIPSPQKRYKETWIPFFGSTICYAHMQATDMINDHPVMYFHHSECVELR
jgi:DNA-3-methyladenine glycosylase I